MKYLLFLAFIFLLPHSADAGRLWHSSAEMRSVDDGDEVAFHSGVGLNLVASTSYSGTRSWEIKDRGTSSFLRQDLYSTNQSAHVYMAARIYIVDYPTVSDTYQVIRFSNVSNTLKANIRMSTTGQLTLRNSANGTVGTTSAALSLNQWYCVELRLDGSTPTNAIEGRIDGVTFAVGDNNATSTWGRAVWGGIVVSTSSIYYDDIRINDSSGTDQNSWPGCDSKLMHLRPNAAGDNNAWYDQATTTGTTDNYNLVNEFDPNITNYVMSSTTNQRDMYNVEDTGLDAYDTINVVTVGIRHANLVSASAVTTVRARIIKTSGGTGIQGDNIIPNTVTPSTDSVSGFRHTLVTYADPDSSPWTNSTLDSMQIGMTITAGSSVNISVSTIWAYVDYIDGAAPPSGSSTPQRVLWFQ